MLISPEDNFANSSFWYVGVYAVGCRSLEICAAWAAEYHYRFSRFDADADDLWSVQEFREYKAVYGGFSTFSAVSRGDGSISKSEYTSYAKTSVGGGGTGCGPDWAPCEPSTRPGKDCGCDPASVEEVSFTLTAARVPRLGLYQMLMEGSNVVSLRSPFDAHQYFTVEVIGSAAVHFTAQTLREWSIGQGSFDLFVSNDIPYPQRASLPPESYRSESALGNPSISITVLRPEGEKSHVKVGMHSSGSVDVEVTISFSPPYFPLVLGRNYVGILRLDKFSSTGQKRYLSILGSDTHQGRRLVLRVRPTNPRCFEATSKQVSACESLSCCARNPFGGFNIEVAVANSMTGNHSYAVSAPNAICIDSGPCDSMPTKTCCREYKTYEIEFDAQLAPRWFISITGANESEYLGPRFTDSFEFDVKAADSTNYVGGQESLSHSALAPVPVVDDTSPRSDNAQGSLAPQGRYSFQSAKRKAHLGGKIEEQPIIDLQDGKAETRAVELGRWRIFRFRTALAGILTITVDQHSGSFGLRLLVQREVLPTLESFLTFPTSDPSEASVCTTTTGVGASTCRRCSRDMCVCDVSRGDNCTGRVHGSVLTEARSNDPRDGARASLQAPVYPKEPFMIAVFGESEVFAPYSFTLTARQDVETYAQNLPCANLSAGEVRSGRILVRERVLLQAPPIPEGFDAEIRLETPYSNTWGKCRWGGNDGTACTYDATSEVYTGLSDRPYDANCRGCFVEKGWKYFGTPLRVAYRTTRSDLYDVPGQHCSRDGAYINNYNVTSKDTYPFYRTYTRWNTDPNLQPFCDLNGKFPWLVPQIKLDEMVEAIQVDKDDECCDKCAREPTCSFWTITDDDNCTSCEQQDVPLRDVYVRPAGNVTFIPGTGGTEWYNSAHTSTIRGPRCSLATRVRCCRLLNIDEAEMLQRKVPDAKATSGSSARCAPATNGHVQLKVAQSVSCAQSSAAKVNNNLITGTTESIAPEAYSDDRQLFHLPGDRDNAPVCVQWWNGLSTIDTGFSLEAGPAGRPGCVTYSTSTIKLKVKDEANTEQCFVNIGAALPSTPKMYGCRDTVYRMGNGTQEDWEFYSVDHEFNGGFGVEWNLVNGHVLQKPSLGAAKNSYRSAGGCLSLLHGSLASVVVDECADAETDFDTGLDKSALQEWLFTNSTVPGGSKGLLMSMHTQECITGILGCAATSRTQWSSLCSLAPSDVGMRLCSISGFSSTVANVFQGRAFHELGTPLMLELTGILSSSYSLTYKFVPSPFVITAEKIYTGQLLAGNAASSIKYRFMRGRQGTSAMQYYLVVNQLVPVHHPLTILYRHRPISNLPAQRPVGWDDDLLVSAGPFEQSQKLLCTDARISGPFCEVVFRTSWLDFESAIMLTIDIQQTDFSDEDEFISSVKANTDSIGSRFLESGGEDNNCLSMVRIMDSMVIPESAFSGEEMVVRIETTPRIGDVKCGSNTLYAEVTMHQSKTGPDKNGVHVVPFASTALAGPFDFELAVKGSSANDTDVPIHLHVTTKRPAYKSDPVPPGLLGTNRRAHQGGHSQPSLRNLVCATLTVGMPQPVKCGPPQEVHKPAASGVQAQSEGWWTFYYIKVSESAEATVHIDNENGSHCPAHIFIQPATAGEALSVTQILTQSREATRLTVGGSSNSSTTSLLLSPAEAAELYIAILFPSISRANTSNTTSRILRSCNSSANIRVSPYIQNLSLGVVNHVSLSRASKRFLRIHVEEAAYHVISIALSAEGNVAVYLSPESLDLPSQQRPPAANRRVETLSGAVGLGPADGVRIATAGFSLPFYLPSLVLSPEDADFMLQDWILAVFADSAADLNISVARVAVPPVLQLFRDYSLTRPAAASFEWRIPYHALAGQAVAISFVEISDREAEECPLSVFARYSLPPTQESWAAAAGREGGRNSIIVPSQPAQGLQYLFFSAVRCPGGYIPSNTTHCIRLEQCSDGPGGQPSVGLCGNTSSLSDYLVSPPARECSFRFRLSVPPA